MDEANRYKLADMVAILGRKETPSEADKTAGRIPNWVRFGLLRPIGPAHSGRGVHRSYDRYELGKAAVLVQLAKYHQPLSVLQMVAEWFDDGRPTESGAAPRAGAGRKRNIIKAHVETAWAGSNTVCLSVNPESKVISVSVGPIGELGKSEVCRLVLNITAVLRNLR